MRPIAYLSSVAFLLSIAGCSVQAADSAAADEQAASTSTDHLVHGADRAFPFRATGMIETWGKGLWEGYVSFDAVGKGPYFNTNYDGAKIVDGSGAEYPLKTTKIHFDRLPLPVSLTAYYGSGNPAEVDLTSITFEVTKTIPIAANTLSGKFNLSRFSAITTIGSDIPGVALTFAAHAQFFKNFTNGNACSRLVMSDKAGQQVAFDANTPSQQLTLVAPINIQSGATCISSRLATGENGDADFDLDLSSITLGDPQ